MMIPEQFARAVLPCGTTTVVTDPHEIGNVMGISGVEFMIENSKYTPLIFHNDLFLFFTLNL